MAKAGSTYGSGAALTRRSFIRLAGAVGLGATVAGCGRARTGAGPHGSANVQMVYQDWNTPWYPAMVQQALESFHAQHPNIHVFYTPDPEQLDEQMGSDFQAGTAPDVFAGCCDFFASWAQRGHLLDLRPYVDADLDRATIDDWDAAQYAALFLPDGRQFALPKYLGALALYYNKDLFDRRGVDYPDGTWNNDDYLAALQALDDGHASARARDYWPGMLDVSWERIQVHVNAWGGHFVDPENAAHCRMGEPEAIAALRWIRDRMWEDRTMATPLAVNNKSTRQAFADGLLATVEDGSWALKDVLEGARFPIGVAPMPAGPKRRVTLATTDGFAVNASTRHPEAAWELVKYLVSADFGRAMAAKHLLQPARASLIEHWIEAVRDAYPRQTDGLDLAAFADGQVRGYSVTAEVFANMGAARALAQEAWQRILVLGQDPPELMRQVASAIDASQAGPA